MIISSQTLRVGLHWDFNEFQQEEVEIKESSGVGRMLTCSDQFSKKGRLGGPEEKLKTNFS